ncbi:phage major capsid protein [Rhizobium rhizogenes]|uniref:phage major capsid protein n=1 Tax=Rhizobium rhizogenes TaxID=359 RepID=UPI0015739D39|nr:phage major capsid protein [Rhizobium rhizogenes]NTF48507.1 phage major capsid protein [Rhizobium rhizogenes]NTH05892.1 phage major capsid protein [Rhizobium rhizogenes]
MNIHHLKSDRASLMQDARAAISAGKNSEFESISKKIDETDAAILMEERMAAFDTAASSHIARDSVEGQMPEYSISRAIEGFAVNRLEGREAEIHQAMARGAAKTTGLRIPMAAFAGGVEKRAEIVTSTAIADQKFGDFAPFVGPDAVVLKAGARVLDGLGFGKVSIPIQTGSADANITWVPESGAVGLGDMQFSSVNLAPHTAGVYLKVSRRAQNTASIGLEGILRAELNKSMGRIIDSAILTNKGGQAPVGITGTGGLVAATASTSTEIDLAAADLIDVLELASNDGDTFFISHAVASAVRRMRTTDKLRIKQSDVFYDKAVFVSNLLAGKTIVHAKASDIVVGYFNQSGAASVDVIVDTATYSSEGALKLVVLSDLDVNLLRGGASAAWLNMASGS